MTLPPDKSTWNPENTVQHDDGCG